MRMELPGLTTETLPSGNKRTRVRVRGDCRTKITLPFGPDHPDFMEAYAAARRGEQTVVPDAAEQKVLYHSVQWLVNQFLAHMEVMVRAGTLSAATQKQRRLYYERLCAFRATQGKSAGTPFAELHMNIPKEQLITFRDAYADTPGAADNTIKAVKALYVWAVERGITKENPALGITPFNRYRGGAKAWTNDEIAAYCATHPLGTDAHLTLMLLMFTGARISDAIVLGPRHEEVIDGRTWLTWQPKKKGSKLVSLPMMPQLAEAIRLSNSTGTTYLLSAYDTPWGSTDSFRNRFKDWCTAAGLPDRSPHGLRKALGNSLAEMGATQHQIMAVHGHAEASTSEIYTREAERKRLAAAAFGLFDKRSA